MKKYRGILIVGLLLVESLFVAVVYHRTGFGSVPRAFATATVTATVSLSATVTEYLSMTLESGSIIAFGDITPLTPKCYSSTSTQTRVSTNAANGYVINLSDGQSGTNSALAKSGTYIPDFNNTVLPTTALWGSSYGLGVTLWSAETNKDAMWIHTPEGTAVCDTNNKYAGVPQNQVTAHNATGSTAANDDTYFGWKINVDNSQSTGAYNGNVTVTAIAVLS